MLFSPNLTNYYRVEALPNLRVGTEPIHPPLQFYFSLYKRIATETELSQTENLWYTYGAVIPDSVLVEAFFKNTFTNMEGLQIFKFA